MLQVCQCEMLKLNSPTSIKLTDKIFHAVARTAFGIPDQLSFRNSSTKHIQNVVMSMHVEIGTLLTWSN